MDLEVFDSKTMCHARLNKPYMVVGKNGSFSMNKITVDALNLTAGTTISLVRDKSNPKDWYIMRDPNGITLRAKTGGWLTFNAVRMRTLMYNSLGIELTNLSDRFLVSKEPVQHKDKVMYAIITSKPI